MGFFYCQVMGEFTILVDLHIRTREVVSKEGTDLFLEFMCEFIFFNFIYVLMGFEEE